MAGRALVLVVDDEPPILSSLQRLLAFEDLDVAVAGGGDEALARLRAGDVAVVVTDQHMPGIQGVELLRLARSLSPATSRILLSGHIDVELLRTAVNGGEVYRFVAKPWDDDELLAAVRHGVERWRLMRGGSDGRIAELEHLLAERERAIAAHRDLRGLERALFDALPVAVTGIAADGRVAVVNRLAAEAFPELVPGGAAPGWAAVGGLVPSRLGPFAWRTMPLDGGGTGLVGTPVPPEPEDP